jgi:chromosome segregation ATPase
MIESLKNIISSSKKNNENLNENIKYNLMKNFYILKNAVDKKDLIISNLNKRLKNYENDRKYFYQELKLMENEFKDKQNFIENLQEKYHNATTEVEKLNSRIQAFIINLT